MQYQYGIKGFKINSMDLCLLSAAFYGGFSADRRLNQEDIPDASLLLNWADMLCFEVEVF